MFSEPTPMNAQCAETAGNTERKLLRYLLGIYNTPQECTCIIYYNILLFLDLWKFGFQPLQFEDDTASRVTITTGLRNSELGLNFKKIISKKLFNFGHMADKND